MIWVLPLACAAVGLVVLAYLAARVRREIDPTSQAMHAFGRELKPVLLRVRTETRRTRRRFDA